MPRVRALHRGACDVPEPLPKGHVPFFRPVHDRQGRTGPAEGLGPDRQGGALACGERSRPDARPAEGLRVPQHRPGDHGRPHRRLRGRRIEPVHLLRGDRLGRHLEDDERRDDLRAGLRRPAGLVDRRRRRRSLRPADRLRRGRASRTTASRPRGATASTRPSDGGKTWQQVGLADTHHIGRDRRPPAQPGRRLRRRARATLGAEQGARPLQDDRRRRTWTNTKFVDEDTGFVDVAMDPQSPDTLYAASYQRRRTPLGFNGGGPGSGLWKTIDGGASWTRLTKGLPEGELGRIGARRLPRASRTSCTRSSSTPRRAASTAPRTAARAGPRCPRPIRGRPTTARS